MPRRAKRAEPRSHLKRGLSCPPISLAIFADFNQGRSRCVWVAFLQFIDSFSGNRICAKQTRDAAERQMTAIAPEITILYILIGALKYFSMAKQ